LCERVRTYSIPTFEIADANVFKIRQTAEAALKSIRAGEGPQFMECKTYRWREHVGPGEDYDDDYRSRDELSFWQKNDPVIITAKMLTNAERDSIDADVEQKIANALTFAENSPWPESKELFSHVYAK
jgi:pyruvate dehydrogenase E1 component alpha subunit